MPFIKLLAILAILNFSGSLYAWSCPDYGSANKNSIDYHYSVASDILFGRVVSGTYDLSREQTTVFELEIYKSFKGSKSGRIILTASSDQYFEDIVLGENYIFTLYGSNSVSFCGYNIKLGRSIRNEERLRNIPRADNEYLYERIKNFFEFLDSGI